jgi:hypothetical protein
MSDQSSAHVVVYGKPGCHLCDIAKAVIRGVRQRREFRLEEKNILDDPGDYERYKELIPVVLVNGREVARYGITAERFEKALAVAVEAET